MMGDVQVVPAPGALGLDIPSSLSSYAPSSAPSPSPTATDLSDADDEPIAWPAPPNEKTLCAMLEVTDSEDKFVGLLERLVQVYLPKLPPVFTASGAALLPRNAAMLLELHTRLVRDLKAHKGSRPGLCQALTAYAPELTSLHQEFSAGHSAAKALLNRAQVRDPQLWAQWERERADESGPETDGSRPRSFEDLLIAPIQRVCRYHLLVSSLRDGTEEPPVTDAVVAMQAVAAKVDDIVRVRADEDRARVVLERMDPIPGLAAGYLASLGSCLLIGTLDVIYYETAKPANSGSSQAPPVPSPPTPTTAHPLLASGKPQKAKHLAAFLWTGYLVLAKVHTKRVRYEPKRWFPLKIVPPNSLSAHPNPSSTNVIDSGVSDCDASSSDASPLVPEAALPAVSQSPQQLAPPVIQQLQPKKSFDARTKSQLDEPPTLGLGHVQVQPSDQVFPYGIRISFSRHVFELGASCEEERDIWVREIANARVGNELVLARSRSTIPTTVATDEKALVRGNDGAREKSVERALVVRERSKSRERGALSVRDQSRERDDRSRDDRSTIRDDRTVRDDRSTRDPPSDKPPLQRKKSAGVLAPQDGPVQIGNWIVQRLETVTTPAGTSVSAPVSHAREHRTGEHVRTGSEVSYPRDSHTRNASELSHPRNGEVSHRNGDVSHSRNASEYSVPYTNPYASPPTVHTIPPHPDRLVPHTTGSSYESSAGIGERLEHVFLKSRYHGYGYAPAQQQAGYGQGGHGQQGQGQPAYVGPSGSAHVSPSGSYVGPSGQYVGPSASGHVGPSTSGHVGASTSGHGGPAYVGPGGYVGPSAAYSLSRESSQSSSHTSSSTTTLSNYARSDAPSNYARSDAPSNHARSDAPSNYARSDAPLNYPRSDAPSSYAPSTITPSNYARSEAPSNYAPSINAPSTTYSSNSSTPYGTPHGSQVSTPAGYGPNFAGGYTSRFQTRSRAGESTLAANVERAFGVASAERPNAPVERPNAPVERPNVLVERVNAPVERVNAPVERVNAPVGNGLGANVRRTNSSSTDRSRSFPPSPVATAPPALPAPQQPTLTPQQVVRRPSNNTRDPVIMALADVISSTCREARDRASLKRKPLWMTPEEAAAAAEKEKEKAANGMMGMVRPRRMSSALVGKSKTADKDKDKEKDKEKDKSADKDKKKAAVRPSSSEGVVAENPRTALQRKRATIHGAMHTFPSMGPPSPERETQSLSAHGHGTLTQPPVVQQPQQQPPQPPPKPPPVHMRGASEGPISPPRSRTVSSSGSFVDGIHNFFLRRAFAKSAENMALSPPTHDPPNPIYAVGAGLTNTKSDEGLPRARAKAGSVPAPGQEQPGLYALGAGITNTDAPLPKRKPRISLRSSSTSSIFAQLTGKRKASKTSTPMSGLTFTPLSEKDKAEYQAAMRARESRSRSNEYYRRINPNQGGPPNRNMLGAELYTSPASMGLHPSPVAEESRFLEEGDDGVYTGYR